VEAAWLFDFRVRNNRGQANAAYVSEAALGHYFTKSRLTSTEYLGLPL
jgi:hypothetical protein